MKSILKLAAIPLAFLAVSPAIAQQPFYEGKTISVLVGFNPASGTDLFARVIADNLGQYIEGNPTIIVENMPGAGGVIASNHIAIMDHSEGTHLLAGTGQLMMRMILGLQGSQAKTDDFDAVLSVPMGRVTYGHSSLGIENPNEVGNIDGRVFLGVPEVISTLDAVLGLQILGVPFEHIVGYEGKPDTRIAFERQEVNVDSQTTPFYLDTVLPLVETGVALPLFAQGLMANGELGRDPALPDMPTLLDVYRDIHGEDPSGPAWEAYKTAVTAMGNGGKILLVPVSVPDEAKQAINEGINRMVEDPEFLARAASQLEGYPILTGENLQATVRAISDMDEESITWFKDLLSRDFDMRFD